MPRRTQPPPSAFGALAPQTLTRLRDSAVFARFADATFAAPIYLFFLFHQQRPRLPSIFPASSPLSPFLQARPPFPRRAERAWRFRDSNLARLRDSAALRRRSAYSVFSFYFRQFNAVGNREKARQTGKRA